MEAQESSPKRNTPAPQRAGGHYSGANPVPNIKQFIERLDAGKRDRDQKAETPQTQENSQPSKAPAHPSPAQELKAAKGQSKVTDPVTGKEVVIENAHKDMVKEVDNPTLVVPNANLGKPTTAKTDASQSGQEYQYNQDITAPPAPMEPGSTTDVPIHGEKTNILFHPTPSVSFEPMFAALEKQAGALCIGVFVAVVVLGKMFGGRLVGLVPLAMCLTSGIWLWMKEVLRSGREVEWSSEKARGKAVSFNDSIETSYTNIF